MQTWNSSSDRQDGPDREQDARRLTPRVQCEVARVGVTAFPTPGEKSGFSQQPAYSQRPIFSHGPPALPALPMGLVAVQIPPVTILPGPSQLPRHSTVQHTTCSECEAGSVIWTWLDSLVEEKVKRILAFQKQCLTAVQLSPQLPSPSYCDSS